MEVLKNLWNHAKDIISINKDIEVLSDKLEGIGSITEENTSRIIGLEKLNNAEERNRSNLYNDS